MAHDFVIWRDVPVIIKNRHDRYEWGDIPCVRLNEITQKFETVENRRGIAYAARKRMKYRRKYSRK